MNEVQIKDKTAYIAVEPIAVGVPTAAKLLGISDHSLYDIINSEGFPSFKIGGRVLVSVEGLRKWVEARTSSEPGKS